MMRMNYARALYKDDGATLDDLREAVTTLEDIERTARRVLGGAHPGTAIIERSLRDARAALRAARAAMRVRSQWLASLNASLVCGASFRPPAYSRFLRVSGHGSAKARTPNSFIRNRETPPPPPPPAPLYDEDELD